MKKLIFLFLLLPFSLFAQTDSVVFKGAKRIIIKTDLPAAEGYKLIVNSLLDQGYAIEQTDKDLFTVKTQEKQIEKRSYQYFLNIRAKDNEIVISGRVRTGMELSLGSVKTTDDYSDISFKGVKGSAFKDTFKEMDLFAKNLNKPISYQ